jgi:hypothetical protein
LVQIRAALTRFDANYMCRRCLSCIPQPFGYLSGQVRSIQIDAAPGVAGHRNHAQRLLGADIKRIAVPSAVLIPGIQSVRIGAFRSMKCS